MAYFRKQHNPHLSEADRIRISAMSDNEYTRARKFKAIATYIKPKLAQEICITVYGETKAEIEEDANSTLKQFRETDKAWKLSKLEYLKDDTENDQS